MTDSDSGEVLIKVTGIIVEPKGVFFAIGASFLTGEWEERTNNIIAIGMDSGESG